MVSFPVTPKKQLELKQRMRKLGVREADLQESFIRSRGAGGQNVNKVSTCVVLRHTQMGIEVRCQRERSQALNRFLARRVLLDRVEAKILKWKSDKIKQVEKIRRQKRKRFKRTQEKLLETKRLNARKRALRKSPTRQQVDE